MTLGQVCWIIALPGSGIALWQFIRYVARSYKEQIASCKQAILDLEDECFRNDAEMTEIDIAHLRTRHSDFIYDRARKQLQEEESNETTE